MHKKRENKNSQSLAKLQGRIPARRCHTIRERWKIRSRLACAIPALERAGFTRPRFALGNRDIRSPTAKVNQSGRCCMDRGGNDKTEPESEDGREHCCSFCSGRDEPGGYRTFVTCGVACGRSIELAFKVKIVLCYYQLFMLYFYDPLRQRMTPPGSRTVLPPMPDRTRLTAAIDPTAEHYSGRRV